MDIVALLGKVVSSRVDLTVGGISVGNLELVDGDIPEI